MNISAAFAVLSSNGKDIEDIVAKMGGVGAVISILPDILRISQTAMAAAPGASPAQAIGAATAVLAYSKETEARVRAFQVAHGLAADGVVGNETWDAVERLLGSK